jgi:hypothetical protein
MFILAHQFRRVSSENKRAGTYPAEFGQTSDVLSVKHTPHSSHAIFGF